MKKDGKYLPLRFVSRVLTKLERAYENREREIRAGVYAMQSLHVYLEHRVFNWAVDHMNITFIMKASATNGRIARLALWLSCWWYNLVHLAGDHVLMQIADAISRLAIENSHDPENIAIPFEDDSVQNRLIENIDLEKAIMTYHASQHEVSGTHTGVVNRDGTAMAVPKSSDNTPEKSTIAAMENFSDAESSKFGGKIIDLTSPTDEEILVQSNEGTSYRTDNINARSNMRGKLNIIELNQGIGLVTRALERTD